jgi:2'-5' RNA ligase
MRTFIAIEIPPEVKSALAAMQNDLHQAGADVAWTNFENVHLTLKFLGEIDKQVFSKIEKVSAEVAASFSPFEMSISETGVFPNVRHPRVLWVGLDGETGVLDRLQEELDERLVSIGFEPEEKDFRPHLTLGRIRSNKNVQDLLAQAHQYSLPTLSFVVREIALMKSDLLPTGAQYSELAKAKLKES